MLDVSDGLLRDAGRIARASECGIEFDSAVVPVHPAATEAARVLGVEALPWALTGGEDHSLLATFPASAFLPDGWTKVGVVTTDYQGVRVDGTIPEALGWDHFAS